MYINPTGRFWKEFFIIANIYECGMGNFGEQSYLTGGLNIRKMNI